MHAVTHRHETYGKEGLGDVLVCGWRGSPHVRVMFQPDLDGAKWHPVPDTETMEAMLGQKTPEQAMAVLRGSS